MPFARRRRAFRRGSSTRRATAWDWNGYLGVATPANTYADWMLWPAISEANLRSSTNLGIEQLREDFTLEKTIVDYTAQAFQSATTEQTFWIGLAVFESRDPSLAPNVAEVPNPTDGSEEWIWRQAFPLPKNFTGSPILTIGSLTDPNKTIMKGRRKLSANTGIVVVASSAFMESDLSFNLQVRFLLKKPR